MKKFLVGLAFMAGIVLVSSGIGLTEPEVAQPAAPAADSATVETVPEDELKYTFGSVVKVGGDEVTILEYNDEAEQEIEVAYKIDGNTQYRNINALSELAANDSVEIFYQETNGVKTITQIIKEMADDLYDDMGEASEDSGDLGTGEEDMSLGDAITDEDDAAVPAQQ